MSFLTNKKFLITGIASQRSIASGIAEKMFEAGAELAFTYQNDKLKERVLRMAESCKSNLVFPCDVANDQEITSLFENLKQKWDGLDGIVHSIAYAPAEELEGSYLDTVTRKGFNIAHEISSYSFAALAKAGLPMMEGRSASLLTLTYIGAERAFPNYNVMGLAKASLEANVRYMAHSLGPKGIRVNAISAGPIRTLAASGIKSFRKMLEANEKITPLRRNVTIEEVGNVGAFLGSDLSSGITGEIIHVDNGFHCVGLGSLED